MASVVPLPFWNPFWASLTHTDTHTTPHFPSPLQCTCAHFGSTPRPTPRPTQRQLPSPLPLSPHVLCVPAAPCPCTVPAGWTALPGTRHESAPPAPSSVQTPRRRAASGIGAPAARRPLRRPRRRLPSRPPWALHRAAPQSPHWCTLSRPGRQTRVSTQRSRAHTRARGGQT
eukprot:270071-Chlamydomonas_euryale.AAC.5